MENSYYSQGYVYQEHNPLRDLIPDDVFSLLKSNGLLNEVSIRDRVMRSKFKELREQKISTTDAIDMLKKEFPYLQFETIKKIVHHPRKPQRS